MAQPHDTDSLLWYRDPTASLHRRLGPDLGFQFAHVEVGAERLATERPAFGASSGRRVQTLPVRAQTAPRSPLC